MPRSIRTAIGFIVTSLLLLGIGLLSAAYPQMASAEENNAGGGCKD